MTAAGMSLPVACVFMAIAVLGVLWGIAKPPRDWSPAYCARCRRTREQTLVRLPDGREVVYCKRCGYRQIYRRRA